MNSNDKLANMLKAIFFTIILISSSVSAYTPIYHFQDTITRFPIIGFNFEDETYRMILKTFDQNKIIVLDCHSFIQELNVYEKEQRYENLLMNVPIVNDEVCIDMGKFVMESMEMKAPLCLTYDHSSKQLLLERNRTNCKSE